MSRILLMSDTHIGITQDSSIRKMLKLAQSEDFDVIVHAGDYCGGTKGWRAVKHTVRLIREFFPDKPFVSVIGNHDYWYKKQPRYNYIDGVRQSTAPSLQDFNRNYEQILEVFKNHNVHFLDTDGPIIFNDMILVGHSGWYKHPNPGTNDVNYLPHMPEGATANNWMYKKVIDGLDANLLKLDAVLADIKLKNVSDVKEIVFVSHFPVVRMEKDDYKGAFDVFCWSEHVKEHMEEHYNCQYFLNGHSHMDFSGPLRYESGSDYCHPRYKIVHIV